MASPLDIAEDFGQSVDLTRRIREILSNYPEGTTVLKELIQNADDAGATQISFCLDRRQHGVDSLLFRELGAWQGPALLAFNNAQFSDEDFESISKVGGSKKQKQPWKTGRFGVGFNSVYHLSDLPSFVSGKYIVFFDPHCKFLPNISAINPGKRINFVNSDALNQYKDQFEPYCAFGCDMKNVYSGTMFRLPLRTVTQAADSLLSKQSYSQENILHLLRELHLEANLCMLFLKNIEMINIYDWEPNSEKPNLLYSCCIKSVTDELRWHRRSLTRISSAWTAEALIRKQLDSFVLHFENKIYAQNELDKIKLESFLVVQCLETPQSQIGQFSSRVAQTHGVCLLPWVAVAAKISENGKEITSQNVIDGRAYCFLPLPVKTNLPVHVNGFFELSSNRRDIWYGLDMEGMGKIRSDWNTILLNDVVALAYTHLLLVAPEVNKLQYTFWPSGSHVDPWKSMVAEVYKQIAHFPLLHSDVKGGKWLKPSEAVFHDEEMPHSEDLILAFTEVGLSIVRLPKILFQMISYQYGFGTIHPSMVRQHLQNNCSNELQISWKTGLTLLEYCLGDVVDDEASDYLLGVPLVPLANGAFGIFGRRNAKKHYFICSEKQYILLSNVNNMLIERKLPNSLYQRLCQIGEASSTNIYFLQNTDFVMFLSQILPMEWKNKDEIKWLPNSEKGHPSESWMAMLWDYLRDSSKDLSAFDNWPILPTKDGFLCKMKRSLAVIKGDALLSPNVENILVELGCRILRSDLQIDHPSLSKCVHLGNPTGILDAISCYCLYRGLSYEKIFSNITSDKRCQLRCFLLDFKWYGDKHINDSQVQILKSLPIFEVFNSDSRCLVDLISVKKYIPPKDVDECLLGLDFLLIDSKEIDFYMRILNVEIMERATFFRLRVINRISELMPDVRNRSMITILKELPVLSLQDMSLKETLRNLSFVPTPGGELKPPKCLYDPRIQEFSVLLNENESLPSESFRNVEILDMLQLVGLQTMVSPDTILQSARQVALLLEENHEESITRGFMLLSYLEDNAAKLFPLTVADGINNMFLKVTDIFQSHRADSSATKRIWNEIASICWCPVLVDCPHLGLPWPVVSTLLAPPRLVRLPSDLWLASASMRILKRECRSAFLSQKLGWNDTLGGNVLAAQLLELGKNNINSDNPGLKKVLATVIPKIYALLSEKIGTEEIEIVKAMLEGSQWVWVGDTFVTVQEVVLSGPLHLAPYLWVIPTDLSAFNELLIELGVKESLTTEDFIFVLSKMAKEKNGLALDSNELKTVIWILQHLADLDVSGQTTTLFVPDSHGILVPSADLAYNDAPWLVGAYDSRALPFDAVIKNIRVPTFVHANISNDVADRLGIRSLRRLLLAESADSMDMTLHGSAEAFGQHEALTTRLKHIVDMYADGPGILCELLQNSDDAGASEVIFLLDQSQFGTSSLLSPKMADWQGPALYCFNNSVFTSKDLHAISRIGQDSKLEKTYAVGRFGLGFNSVYHFTDVPSFVSGTNFVIFDPHASHLPGISPSHPGLKINFVGKGIATHFPDQCNPYMLFGCDMQNSYQGTLFRFPLRNSVTAAHSQIKQSAYGADLVLNLFRNFEAVSSEVLLFLHNVTSVTVYIREDLDQGMHMLYRTEKHGTQNKAVYQFVRNLKTEVGDKDLFYEKLGKIPMHRLPSDCQLITITMYKGDNQFTQQWMVSECLGGYYALEMATRKDNRTHGFIPWTGVAVRLRVEENGVIDEGRVDSNEKSIPFDGRAFCFLPLPTKTGLPVHVNAYFELSSNRRDIWYGDDMAGGGKLRSEWNYCLLKEASPLAYVKLLANLSPQLGPSIQYYSVWPTGSPPQPWDVLLSGFYLSAAEMDVPILYTIAKGGQWISAKKAVFPDYSYVEADKLGQALADAGLSIVNAPKSIVAKFHDYCPSLKFMSPQMLRSSLVRRNRALNSRTAMLEALKYCLSDVGKNDAGAKLEGLPLIPLANGTFTSFTSSSTATQIFVVEEVEYNLLKEASEERFVDLTIECHIIKQLQGIADTQSTNLAILSPAGFSEFLHIILPSDWRGKGSVRWTPGEANHPSREWIEWLWNYLNGRSADLSLFTNWPILPTADEKHLLKLTKTSNVLIGDTWSENMHGLLHKANCFTISSTIKIAHPQLGDYVHDATASGLLEAFLSAAGGFKGLPLLLKELSKLEVQELRGFLFQKKWFVNHHMHAAHVEILKHLPVFRSYISEFVSLSDSVRFFPPDDVDLEILGDDFIHPESEKEEYILKTFLGIQKIEKDAFYRDYAFKHLDTISMSIHERVILNLLKNLSSLEKDVPSIRTMIFQIPIIPTPNGKRMAPTKLYDPRIQELHCLLGEEMFPTPKFSDDDILDVLKHLGLKTSLRLEDLLDSAHSVAFVALNDEKKAVEMGKYLLSHIDKLGQEVENAATLSRSETDSDVAEQSTSSGSYSTKHPFEPIADVFVENCSKEFWQELNTISWCPALVEAPLAGLPWPKGLTTLLVPPRIVRPKSQMWHVSATMRILDGNFSSRTMMSKFGWLEKPNMSVLVMQLIELSEQCCKLQAEPETKDTHKEFYANLEQTIPSVYNLLEDSLNAENADNLRSMLDGTRCVWVGDGFVLPKQAAFTSPSHFRPYLNLVPTNVAAFRNLLLSFGVRETFEVMDFVHAIQCISLDMKGKALSQELLNFVIRVLEAIDELLVSEKFVVNERFLNQMLVPDANGVLSPAKDLIYNDAPWLLNSVQGLSEMKRLVHSNVPNELADRLGAKSLRYLSFVDKEMTKDLPCLSFDDISKIITSYGSKESLLFDLLEVADKCKAHTMHVLYDKRAHPQTSVLQPNLGQFQGVALTVFFEGTELTTEAVCNLQLSSSGGNRGQGSNYGGGLLSCYSLTDFLLLVSSGCLYLFDPSGQILAPSLTNGKAAPEKSPKGKAYTLQDTDIPQRFSDQFLPFFINEKLSWSNPCVTIVRMPLYFKRESSDHSSEEVLNSILKNFISHAPTSLLFLNSVDCVRLIEWEADQDRPSEFFSAKIDPACTSMRNPFLGRSSRKFQLSSIFNTSTNLTKMNIIDVLINQEGICILDKWIVALSFGCGQTRNLAIDRRLLSYNLSPVAGVAVHVSRNGSMPTLPFKGNILCPLPLLPNVDLPVIILGNFIVSHEGFRHLFPSVSPEDVAMENSSSSLQRISFPAQFLWNRELMTCVSESYIQLLSDSLHVRLESSSKSSQIPRGIWKILSDKSYSLWPLSGNLKAASHEAIGQSDWGETERKWLVESLIRPMYVRLADLPVWKLHGGLLIRAAEGMFLSNPNMQNTRTLPSESVCEFLKEHYKVFAVPCELTQELQRAGITVKVITPQMVRHLLRALTTLPKVSSVERYVDLLEYSCADFENIHEYEMERDEDGNTASGEETSQIFNSNMFPQDPSFLRNRSPSNVNDTQEEALDIVSNIRRALVQFGKGVVEDISTDIRHRNSAQMYPSEGSSKYHNWLSELKGLPCPTTTMDIVRLGKTEIWFGNNDQQKLLMLLASKFVHVACLERPLLVKVFSDPSVQRILQIKPFTVHLLSLNLSSVLPRRFYSATWVEWDYKVESSQSNVLTSDWLRLFWRIVKTSAENLTLFQHWTLIPAVLDSTVLVKVQFREIIFFPPKFQSQTSGINADVDDSSSERPNCDLYNEYQKAFAETPQQYPWLFPFLQQCRIPIFDQGFLDCEVAECFIPNVDHGLGDIIRSKLLAAQQYGYLTISNIKLTPSCCDALFSFFAHEFYSDRSKASTCSTRELELLRSLPIYKTTVGTYTNINLSLHCTVVPGAFFQPQNDNCLMYLSPEMGGIYYEALGIPTLSNNEILLKFCLPQFGNATKLEQERILFYVYSNWEALQHDDTTIAALSETKFVQNGERDTTQLFQPRELLDPSISLFRKVYKNKPFKFPGESFRQERWLDIIRKAGLHSTLDAETLLDCTREVEQMGLNDAQSSNRQGSVSEEIFEIADAVVETIMANFASIYGSSFFQPLSEIVFVPTEIGHPKGPVNDRRRVLASYRELVLLKDWPLAWTCSPILTKSSLVPPEFSWHLLHLQSPPGFQVVLRHLQAVGHDNGETVLARWPSSIGMMSVEDAFLEVFKYLEKTWDSLSDSEKEVLQTISFIPVSNGTRLCPANRIFVHLEMNLAPFAFQLPKSYLPFVRLLTSLGMQESPTTLGMQNLLLQMHNIGRNQPLSPNELRAVFKILDFLCGVTGNNKQKHVMMKNAVVPDDKGRLLHASISIYIDAPARGIIGKIDTSRLRFVHPHLGESHCVLLGVRKLSEVVKEILNDNRELDYRDHFGATSKSIIVEKLKSKTFQLALWSLMQDFTQEMAHLKSWSKIELQKELDVAAECLQCVRDLYTRLVIVDGNVDVTKLEPGSAGNRVYEYVDKKNRTVILAEPPDFISSSDILSIVISKLVEYPVCLPISGLFSVPVGFEQHALEILRMRPNQHETHIRQGNNHVIVPGDELTSGDSAYVRVHPLRPYYAGEIVAWCSNFATDGKLRYGVVVDDVRSPSGQALHYVKVETSPGEIQSLLSSNVFSFKNVISEGGIQSSEVSLAPSSSSMHTMTDQQTSQSSQQEISGRDDKSFMGSIPASVVVQAVNDMMSAAGLPVALDQQNLLKQTLGMQEELSATRAALSLEQERAETAVKEAEAAKTAWQCRVCLNVEVNSLLVPCGHVMCESCCSAVTRCPFCRQRVTTSVRLYRP